MDSSGATPTLQVPRLRLSRIGTKFDEQNTPQAGPSRLSPGSRTPVLNGYDDSDTGDDAQSTPRLPMFTTTPSESYSASATPIAETPSARLRALLARVPHSPSTPKVAVAPSEPDSDFDPPRSSPLNTPSIARSSLKDLFSRALRDPGDTPQKTRRRRSSIDVSEVEASPRAERERAKNRGQRRTASDEELEKQSQSATSSKASQAVTFDILRARLTNSQTQIMNQQLGDSDFGAGLTETSTNDTDNESFLRGIEQVPASPVATSTPHRTMQLPSEIQFQSDLMESDSGMQEAMKDLESFEGASRPVSFPSARPSQAAHSVPGRPLSHASGSKVHSMSRTPGTRPRVVSTTKPANLDHSSSSRASSAMGQPDFREQDHSKPKEQVHQREMGWNKPKPTPKTPENHRHSYSSVESHSSGGAKGGSPMLNLTNRLGRKDSVTSLKSMMDDGMSSVGGSSVGSQADYRERIRELEKDRNTEREREWNKRHSTGTSRPTSSMSMNSKSPHFERSRTQSQPMRPDSSLHYTPDNAHPSMYRHQSYTSPRSRASSRSSSVSRGSSKELEEEIQHEVDHTRERNWNSPLPQWDPNDRAVSPSLRASSPRPNMKHSHSLSYRGARPESPTAHLNRRPRSSLSFSSVDSHNGEEEHPLAKSTSPQGAPPLRASRSRSHSITNIMGNTSAASRSSPANRFGWQFPVNKTRLEPIEFDEHSPERQQAVAIPVPSPSPSPVKSSFKAKGSHIPMRAVKTPEVNSTVAADTKPSPRVVEQEEITPEANENESDAEIPPSDNDEFLATAYESQAEDAMYTSDEDPPSPLRVEATALQVTEIPEEADEVPLIFSPPVSPEAKSKNDSSSLRKDRAPSPTLDPPPMPEFTLSLATPPRPRSANSSRPEFQTPPTPADLPRLPEPPSDDESDADWTPEPPAHLDFSSMKTPKPPGGWNYTPIAPQRDLLTRANTLPDSDTFGGGSSSENGLATPLPSLSRATTLPFQTPAPPGAWVNTPGGTDRRKSIMKVRFDMESEQSASDVPNVITPMGDLNGLHPESPSDLDLTPTIKSVPIPASPTEVKVEEVLTPITPRSTPPASLRRSPVVRVVDAFGREQKVESDKNAASTLLAPPTPRSRSSVRIMDAMGREVEEKVEEELTMDITSDEELLSHNEALRRVRQSIADLASGLSDVESSSNEIEISNQKMSELKDVSQAARDARRRLEETLRMAREAEMELRSKMSLNSNFQYRSSWRPTSTFIFGALALQVAFIFIMYRFSDARAKSLFLNRYYDSYYPHLHLYVTKPDTIRRSMDHARRWSIWSVPGALYRGGLRAVADDAWRGVAGTVYDLQRHIWDTWGTPAPASWPPT